MLVFDRVAVDLRGRPGVLKNVTLEVGRGEVVAVWGTRRSGRTTLLRTAAGLLHPSSGVVRVHGTELRGRSLQVGWCEPSLSSYQRGSVAEHVAVPLLPRGVPHRLAVDRAHSALARAGVPDVGRRDPRDLDAAELVRAGIARAIIARPLVVLADQPTYGVGLLDADPIAETLRSIADEGVAVLVTIGDGTEVRCDRTVTLGDGILRGETVPEPAPILPIR